MIFRQCPRCHNYHYTDAEDERCLERNAQEAQEVAYRAEITTIRSLLRDAGEMLERLEKAAGKYAEWMGPLHSEDCPGDDTCDGKSEQCEIHRDLCIAFHEAAALLKRIREAVGEKKGRR